MGEEDFTMNQIIREKIREIEESEQVKILHAVESGSRAWGFASPDSDYDVRFIYVRSQEFYLRLEKTRDVIEWQLDDTLDINGWDIRKVLSLLYKSNPTIFEWCSSPIIYQTDPAFQEVRETVMSYFCCKSGIYHYLSTARNNYKEHLRGEQVKLKKYFYALRPILACQWILHQQTPPPMLFSVLMDAELPGELRADVETLLDLKSSMSEMGESKRINAINRFIEDSIEGIGRQVAKLKDEPHEWQELNRLFQNCIAAAAPSFRLP